jgi:uncharacterized membrane protein
VAIDHREDTIVTKEAAKDYRVEGQVEAPSALVWDVMTDFGSMPEWTASVARIQVLGGADPVGVGTRVRIHQPRLAPATWVIDQWRPEERFSWTSRFVGVRTTGTHIVTPVSEDSCSVALMIAHRGPLASPVGRLTAALTRRYMAMELAGLMQRAEGRAHKGDRSA